MSTFTITQISAALGVHKTSVMRRANKEGWPFTEEPDLGGKKRLYALADLPKSIQKALKHYADLQESGAMAEECAATRKMIEDAARDGTLKGREFATEAERVRADNQLNRCAAGIEIMRRWPILTAQQMARMLGRMDIVQTYRGWLKDEGRRHGNLALNAFAHIYTDTGAGRSDETRTAIKKVSGRNLRRWVDGFAQRGLEALLDEKDGKALAGHGKIEDQEEMRVFVVALLVEFPHIKDVAIDAAISTRFVGRLAPVRYSLKDARAANLLARPEVSAIRRFREAWQKQHSSAYLALRNPDKWKNEQMLAFGNASEDVVRPNYRWEMDSTPGDVLLLEPGAANGTARYHVLGVIDVWPRRARLLVAKTSKSEAIGSLVRRAIIDWGRPERVKHDNGSDYCANYLNVFFTAIGTEIELCQPFSGWHKPHIERLFRTFNHGLVELLAGYIGHNVAERKELEARASFSQRLFQKDGVLEVRMTADEFQTFCDEWCDNIYEHNPHEGLNGETPFQRMASWTEPVAQISDERALDVLLAPLAGRDGFFSLQKKGIRINGHNFIAAELGHYAVGDRFQVRQDVADAGRVFVFDDAGRFVCVAISPELTGISPKEIANAAKAIQRRDVREEKDALRKVSRKANTKEIVSEVLRDRAATSGKLTTLPPRGPTHTTAAIDAAGKAARVGEAPPAAAQTVVIGGRVVCVDDLKQKPAEVISLPAPAARSRSDMSSEEVYAEWLEVGRRLQAEEAVSEQDRNFHRRWPESSQGKVWFKRHANGA